jgi:hypothetical protein
VSLEARAADDEWAPIGDPDLRGGFSDGGRRCNEGQHADEYGNPAHMSMVPDLSPRETRRAA